MSLHREIAERLGVSESLVRTIDHELKRAASPKRRDGNVPPDMVRRMRALHAAGLNGRQIAEKTGYSAAAVANIIRRVTHKNVD